MRGNRVTQVPSPPSFPSPNMTSSSGMFVSAIHLVPQASHGGRSGGARHHQQQPKAGARVAGDEEGSSSSTSCWSASSSTPEATADDEEEARDRAEDDDDDEISSSSGDDEASYSSHSHSGSSRSGSSGRGYCSHSSSFCTSSSSSMTGFSSEEDYEFEDEDERSMDWIRESTDRLTGSLFYARILHFDQENENEEEDLQPNQKRTDRSPGASAAAATATIIPGPPAAQASAGVAKTTATGWSSGGRSRQPLQDHQHDHHQGKDHESGITSKAGPLADVASSPGSSKGVKGSKDQGYVLACVCEPSDCLSTGCCLRVSALLLMSSSHPFIRKCV